MKWHRPEFNNKAMNIKPGDVVKLRHDITKHKDEVSCYYVSKHALYEGKEVVIKSIRKRFSDRGCVWFNIEGSGYAFDTDMIDWNHDNDVNYKSELLNWMKKQ